jgi:hypothetical protein
MLATIDSTLSLSRHGVGSRRSVERADLMQARRLQGNRFRRSFPVQRRLCIYA